MLRRIYNAIRWRVSFVRRRIPHEMRRRAKFVRAAKTYGFSTPESVRATLKQGSDKSFIYNLFRSRLRRAEDGAPYFDIAGKKIFFPLGEADLDQEEALEGTLFVLKEAFFQEDEFFSGEVRIRPGDTVLDLGGNIGTAALLFSDLVGNEGRVFTFEPIFQDVLGRTLRENDARNVRLIPFGVADAPGTATFNVTAVGIDSRMVNFASDPKGIQKTVPLTSLDTFVAENGLDRVDFIKMDIEGAEELALEGAKEVLARFRPKLTIASYHTHPDGSEPHPRIVGFLKEQGYEVEEVGQQRIYAWHPETAEIAAA